jgi:uncharacterized membrane protein YdjX (TVP38/TMEM64 family)
MKSFGNLLLLILAASTHLSPGARYSVLALVPSSVTTLNAANKRIDVNAKGSRLSLDKLVNINTRMNQSSLVLRGGSSGNNADIKTDQPPSKLKKLIIPTVLSALVFTTLALNREAISAFNFKDKLATKLDSLAALGTPGIVMYIFAFICWEITVGVTTPVETAAGMAFGLKNGIIANAIGKTSGAVIAFLLGKYVLKDFVEKKLEGNELMELVQDSIVKNPVRVSLIWRFSFLPEQIKNFGLAVLPVKTWQFVTAVLLHGFPFTLLWSFLGNEMGLILRGTMDSPSRTLKMLMVGVYIFGFIISPSMVGLWVKGLKDEKTKKLNKDAKK